MASYAYQFMEFDRASTVNKSRSEIKVLLFWSSSSSSFGNKTEEN